MSKKTAVVIANNLFQPRIQRRIDLLQRIGYKVHCYAFRRNYYSVNEVRPDLNLHFLGHLNDRRYFRRLFVLAASVLRIRRGGAPKSPDLLYCFGLDCVGIGLMAGISSHALVYEVADLRYSSEARSIGSRFLTLIEKQILKRVTHLALTSEGFLDQYRRVTDCEAKEVLILENKLPQSFVQHTPRPEEAEFRQDGAIRIGFIGLIRYLPCLLPFIEAVGQRKGRYKFLVFGDGSGVREVQELASRYDNVEYGGPFRNPDDLARIYQSIDVSFSVYDNRDFNVRVAIPNKLFESIYFCRPLIAAEETALARRIHKLGVGFSIRPFGENYPERFLDQLTWDDILKCQRKCRQIEQESLVLSDEILASVLAIRETHPLRL